VTQERFVAEVVAERVRRNIAERGLARALAGAYSDPGAYTPRGDNYQEPIHEWATRAIGIVLDHAKAAIEQRATDRAVAHLVQRGRVASRSWVTTQGSQIATALVGAAHDLGCGCEDSTVTHLQEWAQSIPVEPAEVTL
jgi:hypothetical protein